MNRFLQLALVGGAGYVAYRFLKPQYDFRHRHVVVTGGSRGLGLVLSRMLVDRGARVSICSRDRGELDRANEELTRRGGKVFAAESDVTDRGHVQDFIRAATLMNGPVDVLVNNAGIIQVGPVDVMEEADYERSLRTHFWAALYACEAVVPDMTARGAGRIVNIASFGGKVAVPHLLPYTVGKFALVGFSNGLRTELAEDGIVVTTVCPGLMRTGSHVNAEFKSRHEEEYAWFALGNAIPGLSMSAAAAARKILSACAHGDAEVVLGLPAKVGVAMQAVCPNLTAAALDLVNRYVMPEAGGIGTATAKGSESRGKLPSFVTTLSDRAAAENNELQTASATAARD